MKKMKAIRRDSLYRFGFGVDSMMTFTVCASCHSLEARHKIFCSKCRARLPRTSLYDLYRSCHKACPKCGAVLSSRMNHCPHCGVRVKLSEMLAAK